MQAIHWPRLMFFGTVCAIEALAGQLDRATAQSQISLASGPRAVAISAMILEGAIDSEVLISSFDSVQGDHSLGDIAEAVDKLGLRSSFVRFDLNDPALPDCPVVVRIAREGTRDFHLAVLFGRDRDAVQFIDYPHSRRFMELSELSRLWNGEGLEVRSTNTRWHDLPIIVNSGLLLLGVLIACLSAILIAVEMKKCQGPLG